MQLDQGMLRHGQSRSILGAELKNCVQQDIALCPQRAAIILQCGCLTLRVTSFQLSQRPDLTFSIHKFTCLLITILGITARLQTTYHMMSSLIQVLETQPTCHLICQNAYFLD